MIQAQYIYLHGFASSPASVKAYSVEGVPALRLFRQGQLIHSYEGAITKAKLIDLIDQKFFSPAEA